MSRDDPQMKIRLPAELKASIEAAAGDAGRTMNAEIVSRLQASFGEPAAQEPLNLGPSYDYIRGMYARVAADSIRSQIMMLEAELTRVHRDLLHLNFQSAAAERDGREEQLKETREAIQGMKAMATETDSRIKRLRHELDALEATKLPNVSAESLKKKPASAEK